MNEDQLPTVQPSAGNKSIIIGITCAVLAAIITGGAVYAVESNRSTTDLNNLQTQVDQLKLQLAVQITASPLPVALSTATPSASPTTAPTTTTTAVPTVTPLPSNVTDPAALAVVNSFENDYIALGKDPNNDILRHKLLYNYFVTPTSQSELDLQKTLDGKGDGGPILFSSASASTQLQSYALNTDFTNKYQGKNTDPNVQFIVIDSVILNGAQGNTQTGTKTVEFHLTKESGTYLIDQYYNLITGPTNMFNAFYN